MVARLTELRHALAEGHHAIARVIESLAETLGELGVKIPDGGILERGIGVYFGPEIEALVALGRLDEAQRLA